MLARFPNPQPKFLEEPEPSWWLIACRVAFVAVLLAIIYMMMMYVGFDPLNLAASEVI